MSSFLVAVIFRSSRDPDPWDGTIRIQPRPSLQAPREYDEFQHFGPLDLVWEIFWELVFAMTVILSKMLTSHQVYASTHRTNTEVVLFWRNDTPPHWDGRSDSVGCPVHTSVWPIRQSFFFQAPQVADFKMAWSHNISVCHLPQWNSTQHALVVCTLCICDAIGTSFTRRIFWLKRTSR